MANPQFSAGAFFKSQMESVDEHAHSRSKGHSDALEAAYAAVDVRDKGRCWVTGRRTRTGGVGAKVARDHHHLRGRRVKPEWVTDQHRILTTCREAHRLITLGKIHVEGDDARKAIRFHWDETMTPDKRPFRIKSRRRSQSPDRSRA